MEGASFRGQVQNMRGAEFKCFVVLCASLLLGPQGLVAKSLPTNLCSVLILGTHLPSKRNALETVAKSYEGSAREKAEMRADAHKLFSFFRTTNLTQIFKGTDHFKDVDQNELRGVLTDSFIVFERIRHLSLISAEKAYPLSIDFIRKHWKEQASRHYSSRYPSAPKREVDSFVSDSEYSLFILLSALKSADLRNEALVNLDAEAQALAMGEMKTRVKNLAGASNFLASQGSVEDLPALMDTYYQPIKIQELAVFDIRALIALYVTRDPRVEPSRKKQFKDEFEFTTDLKDHAKTAILGILIRNRTMADDGSVVVSKELQKLFENPNYTKKIYAITRINLGALLKVQNKNDVQVTKGQKLLQVVKQWWKKLFPGRDLDQEMVDEEGVADMVPPPLDSVR